MSYAAQMHDGGESNRGIVPAKQSDEGLGGPQTKENGVQPNSRRTPSRASGPSGLDRVREAARKDGKVRFTALLHHVTTDLLRDSYYRLKKQAAPGVDGVRRRSLERFKTRVREIWRSCRSRTSNQLRDAWQRYVRGWWGYYRPAEDRRPVFRLEGWIRRHIRKCFWLRWHNGRGRANALRRCGFPMPSDFAAITSR